LLQQMVNGTKLSYVVGEIIGLEDKDGSNLGIKIFDFQTKKQSEYLSAVNLELMEEVANPDEDSLFI